MLDHNKPPEPLQCSFTLNLQVSGLLLLGWAPFFQKVFPRLVFWWWSRVFSSTSVKLSHECPARELVELTKQKHRICIVYTLIKPCVWKYCHPGRGHSCHDIVMPSQNKDNHSEEHGTELQWVESSGFSCFCHMSVIWLKHSCSFRDTFLEANFFSTRTQIAFHTALLHLLHLHHYLEQHLHANLCA